MGGGLPRTPALPGPVASKALLPALAAPLVPGATAVQVLMAGLPAAPVAQCMPICDFTPTPKSRLPRKKLCTPYPERIGGYVLRLVHGRHGAGL